MAQNNVDYVDLWSKLPPVKLYRKYLKRSIESDDPVPAKLLRLSSDLREIVAQASPSEHSLAVLSYENVLGSFDLTRSSGPYPNAKAAAQHLVDAFPDSDVRLFFSIRSLDRFLESGYIQRILTRRETREFESYIAGVDLESLSWVPAVRAFESAVGAENLIVWEYESFISSEAAIWRALLRHDHPDSLLVRPPKKSNYSLSDKGLTYMRSLNPVVTQLDSRKFRRFIKKTFGSQKGQSAPQLLDDARRDKLLSQYERDRQDLSDVLDRSAPKD